MSSSSDSSSEPGSDVDSDGVCIYKSPIYCNVVEEMGDAWSDVDGFVPAWGTCDPYVIERHVGRGKFSTVYKALASDGRNVAIKVLVPVDNRKYSKEILILQNLRGRDEIIQLVDLTRDPLTGIFSFVFEWLTLASWKKMYRHLSIEDVKLYMRQLLSGLDYAHSKGIIHRDIKPDNVGICTEMKTLKILDWGLAEFYRPAKRLHPYTGTRAYMSPEQLIGYSYYGYTIDVWAAGLVFGVMLFKKHMFKSGTGHEDQLMILAKVIGGRAVINMLTTCDIGVKSSLMTALTDTPGTGVDAFMHKHPSEMATPEAIDLFKKMTHYDFRFRITARDALKHPFLQV